MNPTDQAPAACAAYHDASRTCAVGAAQMRFASVPSSP